MNPKKTKVFITVKTYPTLSTKYDELVCTAGITDKGKWIRIYPVPFRKLKWEKQYKKYQWIEVNLVKNKSDFRPESYKPVDRGESITLKEWIKSWETRKNIIFKKETVYTNLESLIKNAKDKSICTSLAIFKPKKLVDFKCEPTDKNWNDKKVEQIKNNSKQLNLFNSDKPHEIFKIVKKLPYKFSYVFEDETGKQSKMMIEDWEIGALYWNCLKKDSPEITIQKVRRKYFDEFKQKNLYLFLGTTLKHHQIGKNPFVIIGIFCPPKNNQMSLLPE